MLSKPMKVGHTSLSKLLENLGGKVKGAISTPIIESY